MALSNGSKGFLVVLLLVFGLLGGAAYAALSGGGDVDVADGPVAVEIPEGTGASQVGDLLADEGVISSAFLFKIAARFDGRSSQIRPGTYELAPGSSAGDILDVLTTAPPPAATFTVTIPEGLSVDETLARIAEAEGSPFTTEVLREALTGVPLPTWVPADAFPDGAVPFEGLLFPNTYEFRVEDNPQEILARLVAETDAVLAGITPPEGMGVYQVLVLASLIEREARVREEQATISSVIHNRLAEGMRLQIDATVIYVLPEHVDRVLFEHLEIDSPWNTYVTTGLPPTPISGSGEAAIVAAANPEATDFFYYVAVPETGAHLFGRTLDEHNANVAEVRGE